MRSTLFGRLRAERFHELTEDPPVSRRRRSRTPADDELTALVGLSRRTAHLGDALTARSGPEEEFRTGLRALLVATAERQGIGVTAQEPDPEPVVAVGQRRLLPRLSRTQARISALVGVTVGAVVLSGMSAASDSAMPGDVLYSVKRVTERAAIGLTTSDVERGERHLALAKTRVDEAMAVRQNVASYDRVLTDMENDVRDGVRLLTTAAVKERNPAPLQAIDAFVTSHRMALGGLIGQVSVNNRSRTLWSLLLLDSVAKRAQSLNNALSCGADLAGTDNLGPKPQPRPCGVAATPSARATTAAPERSATPHGRTRGTTPPDEATAQPRGGPTPEPTADETTPPPEDGGLPLPPPSLELPNLLTTPAPAAARD
ncbi:DUF5667 domain-containing protein [Pilimelia terevasa]|uniref:DUF5667 domain-containing protein n=1 Tax=Pilimelia terevasa TaxID=53372 RepID=UPI001665209A|nr:DUF5667 domain-containing protein [Pilimelia terevasa]